jgi:hypothetical protein
MKYFGIEYPENFPLAESAFETIACKLLSNLNISCRGAQLKIQDNFFWQKTSVLFDKLDFEVAEFEEDDLRKMTNELRFLKHCVSGCGCNMHDKAVFKLVSWIDVFDSLSPIELRTYCDTLNVEYSKLQNAQLSHICNTPNEKILRYLSLWWKHTPEKDINLLLDIINQQKLVCDQDKTLATKS